MGFWETDADEVAEAIEGWVDSQAGSESDLRDSLYQHLNQALCGEVVQKEYWIGKVRADLFVDFSDGARVIVEVKKDLQTRNDFHRMIGQIYDYLAEAQVEVVLVLCGDCDPALTKSAGSALEELGAHFEKKAFLKVCNDKTLNRIHQ